MNRKLFIACILVLLGMGLYGISRAQCAHDPTVSGDTLLCPNSNGTLSTQTADSYQWYKRFYSDPTLTPIAGATSQTLSINSADDVLYYFAVEATVAGCAEMSPEKLVDGMVFLGITVSTTGDFTISGEGVAQVCEGDTAYLNVMMPYDTNVVWYNGGTPIPGETGTTLTVTTPGSFTVSASPSVCPSYSEFMGIDIVVEIIDCDSTVDCPHNPTVQGDTMLCPESTGTLTTQVYDSYQWYKHAYSDSVLQPIAGATSQTLDITYFDDVLFYFSVEATLNGCTEMSPKVLVDGWAFASITVMSEGDFTISGNGELIVCEGDTVFLTVMMPYDTNIVWYNNNTAIPGETETQLVVTEAGSYTVEGTPSLCPDFSQTMGIPIVVIVEECSSAGINDLAGPFPVSVYPNPALHSVTVDAGDLPITRYRLVNVVGQVLADAKGSATGVTLDLSAYPAGTYLLEIHTPAGKQVKQVIKR